MKTKHKDKVRTVGFLQEMRRAVPTSDEDSIQEHIETYEKVMEFIEKKKDLMK